MNKKEINIIMLVLCVLGIVANALTILNMNFPLASKIPLVLAILSFLNAINYYNGGYKKEAAVYYYKYINSLIPMNLASTTVAAYSLSGGASCFITFAGIVQFGSVLLLCEARDLGRTKSMKYARYTALLAVVTFATNIYLAPSFSSVFSNIGFMFLGFAVYMMTYAKYEDKKERNRNLEIHADQEILAKNKKSK